MNSPAFHRACVFTATCGFILVIAGALVTSTGSALAVPDWPLAYGQVFPEMKGGVLFEHGHRLIASFVGLCTLALAVWARWAASRGVARLAAFAAAMVIVQGLLGGITVLYELPKPISITHACLGQGFFCVLTAIALWTSPAWNSFCAGAPPHPQALRRLRAWSLSASGAVFLQLVLGAGYRHDALPLWPHVFGAAMAAWLLLLASYRIHADFADRPWLLRFSKLLTALLFLQLALGLGSYSFRGAAVTAAHVACGALLLAASVLLSWTAHRCAQAAP